MPDDNVDFSSGGEDFLTFGPESEENLTGPRWIWRFRIRQRALAASQQPERPESPVHPMSGPVAGRGRAGIASSPSSWTGWAWMRR